MKKYRRDQAHVYTSRVVSCSRCYGDNRVAAQKTNWKLRMMSHDRALDCPTEMFLREICLIFLTLVTHTIIRKTVDL